LYRCCVVCREFNSLIHTVINRLPQTAADIVKKNPKASDGEYLLYGGEKKQYPFVAFCLGLGTDQPREYLTLVNTGPEANNSFFQSGGSCVGTDVLTQFHRLRINPITLVVKTDDFTFAQTHGSLTQHYFNGEKYIEVDQVAYATARSSLGYRNTSGRANIDLTGTPFAVSSSFRMMGYQPSGSGFASKSRQVVSLSGGGFAGRVCPSDDRDLDGGEGSNGGWVLRLKWLPEDQRDRNGQVATNQFTLEDGQHN